jgi:hypothetical protein
MVDWLMEQLTDWITSGLTASLDVLVAVMGGTLLLLPDVTRAAQVRALNGQMVSIVNVCYVIAIIAGFAIAMTHETVQSQYAVKDIAPRLVFGAVAANLSLDWCGRLLVLGQALLDALTGGMLAGIDPAAAVHAQVHAAVEDQAISTLIIVIILTGLIVFLFAAIIFGWIARVGVLVVLVAAAPLALACHSLPQLDSVARLWWRSLLGTIGVQLLQTLVLLAGISVFLTPSASIAAQLGIPGGGVFNLLVLTSLLWAGAKTPGLMRRYVLRSGGGNIGSYLVRVLRVQQIARKVLPGRFGRMGSRVAMRGAR